MKNIKYDLEERTCKLGQNIVLLCKEIPQNNINNPIINQLIRSGTSVGANYTEANGASSRKDFQNKIYICKKEAQETKYWLSMLETIIIGNDSIIKKLKEEVQELILIFNKINTTIRN